MWFWPVILTLVILAIVGGALAGGIFTIVLVPLAGIALISAVVYGLWGRAMEGSTELARNVVNREPARERSATNEDSSMNQTGHVTSEWSIPSERKTPRSNVPNCREFGRESISKGYKYIRHKNKTCYIGKVLTKFDLQQVGPSETDF